MLQELVRRPVVRHGLLLGAAEVLYGIFFRVAGFHFTSPWGWIFYLMLPVAVWATVRAAGRSGYLATVGRATATVAIGAAIYCLQVWLYNWLVDDSLLVSVRQNRLAELSAQGLDATALEASMRTVDLFLQPPLFAAAVWLQLTIAGLLAALVLAPVARRGGSSPRPSVEA